MTEEPEDFDEEQETTGSKTRKKRSVKSGRPLVIVESKAKAKTVARYLGRSYNVKACLGHVRDLPKTSLGIDLEHDFKPNYVTNRDRRDIVQDIKDAAKKASQIYIATDPDREGEAIAWHLDHILKRPEITKRVEFNEVTRRAVKAAMASPREIDQNKVDAQQARRILDRLVGYNLSPYLWRELASGLSAGRVQSVAAKLICDREDEIEKFVPEEYWTIDAMFRKTDGQFAPFQSSLVKIDGEPIKIENGETTEKIVRELASLIFKVDNVNTKTITKRPYAPFITSTLQQEASKRLNYTARKTMTIAQQLYEGIDVGEGGEEGLITYMRTDSVRVSEEAVDLTRELIREKFGPKYLPDSPNIYKSKKRAQDAHEAIRPTVPSRAPEEVKRYLNDEQYKLYNLIWTRFISSQMTPGQDEQLTAEIAGGRYLFRSTHTTIAFDGFRVVFPVRNQNNGNDLQPLPPLAAGESLNAEEFLPEQHFTKPPPRFTTASLVKTLEEQGIGRPSTYAPTISTIIDRKYVTREGQSFKPTPLGRQVNKLLLDKFSDIINEGFTATMEDNLDLVQSGDKGWVESVREFYIPFLEDLRTALDMECPKCQAPIAIRNGRYGAFFACTRYPDCDWRASISPKQQTEAPETLEDKCPKCGKELVMKYGRYGKFVACTGFPDCRYTQSLENSGPAGPETPGEGTAKREVVYSENPCPKCSSKMVLRRSRSGRFWGCEKYPDCDGILAYTVGVKCIREGCDGEFVERRTRKG
ncbi:MAG: type I DNA topoisomerase, partial [bacterium]|nr:type I DNA topoisomerase [bacterium]